MKVGIYDPYLDTLSGGEKYMLTIAKCLAEDNDVFILWDTAEKEIREKAKKKLGIDLRNVNFTKNIFSKNISLVERFIASRRFDLIVYLSDGSIPLVASNLIVHFQFPVEWIKNSPKNKLKFLKVKKIICNSKFTKGFIDKKFGVNSDVLYPPIMIRKLAFKKENLILHVGRFGMSLEGGNYKKQDVMIKAFKEMIDKGLRNWKFAIVAGTMKQDEVKILNLRKMVNKYPIEIIENPSNEVLWKYYEKAKIYWHATGFGEDLEKHPERAEHFGITTVEAMGAGAVPVVINAGGQREIVEDGKSGFLWDTLEELKDKTDKLISDNKLLEKMSEQSQKRAQIFAGDIFCKELKEIIK